MINVSKKVANAWRQLSDTDRAFWIQQAKHDKERYLKEKSAYSGPWQVAVKPAPSKHDPTAPKRPVPAFLAYSNSKRAAIKRDNPGADNGKVSRIVAAMWKKEPDELRNRFIEEAAEKRRRYKAAVEVWQKSTTESTNKPAAIEDGVGGGMCTSDGQEAGINTRTSGTGTARPVSSSSTLSLPSLPPPSPSLSSSLTNRESIPSMVTKEASVSPRRKADEVWVADESPSKRARVQTHIPPSTIRSPNADRDANSNVTAGLATGAHNRQHDDNRNDDRRRKDEALMEHVSRSLQHLTPKRIAAARDHLITGMYVDSDPLADDTDSAVRLAATMDGSTSPSALAEGETTAAAVSGVGGFLSEANVGMDSTSVRVSRGEPVGQSNNFDGVEGNDDDDEFDTDNMAGV